MLVLNWEPCAILESNVTLHALNDCTLYFIWGRAWRFRRRIVVCMALCARHLIVRRFQFRIWFESHRIAWYVSDQATKLWSQKRQQLGYGAVCTSAALTDYYQRARSMDCIINAAQHEWCRGVQRRATVTRCLLKGINGVRTNYIGLSRGQHSWKEPVSFVCNDLHKCGWPANISVLVITKARRTSAPSCPFNIL